MRIPFSPGTPERISFTQAAELGYGNNAVWQNPTAGTQGMSLPNKARHIGGRLAADIASDATRGWYWRYNHPLAIAQSVGSDIAKSAGMGKAGAIAGGFLLNAALDNFSGNFNWNNLSEAGRPMGFAAVTADTAPGADPTIATNPVAEWASRYILGRTGKVLPFERFTVERPDVDRETYDKYSNYMRWNGAPQLLGLENQSQVLGSGIGAIAGLGISALRKTNPIAGAIAGGLGGAMLTGDGAKFLAGNGLLKGTWEGIDGPEVRMLGYRMPLSAIAGTAMVGGGLYLGAKALNRPKHVQLKLPI